jgi:hypothetical protein
MQRFSTCVKNSGFSAESDLRADPVEHVHALGRRYRSLWSFGHFVACLSNRTSYPQGVSTIKDIETAVTKLSRDELSAFRAWFLEFDAEAWDRQFEQDARAGRLDRLADEALQDLHEGRCTDL